MPIYLVQGPTELKELHEQAIAQACIWRYPHTIFVPDRMPVTLFKERLAPRP